MTNCQNFDNLKEQFMFDIKAVVVMEKFPMIMIINWDQTTFQCLSGQC